MATRPHPPAALGPTHRVLMGLVIAGATVIAAVSFAGSYSAVRTLAARQGFGWYSYLLPVAIDAGIVVLLALEFLLARIHAPFPLLRHTAWLLAAATVVFNGASAWPHPLGVAMHATVPCLFVICVEAARHAVGRIADITADRHVEPVRLIRWLLAPPSTWQLWRRMRVWELRSYTQVIQLEQDRLIYQARLRERYGRAWRWKAPFGTLMPLRLLRYGVPLAESDSTDLATTATPMPDGPAIGHLHVPAPRGSKPRNPGIDQVIAAGGGAPTSRGSTISPAEEQSASPAAAPAARKVNPTPAATTRRSTADRSAKNPRRGNRTLLRERFEALGSEDLKRSNAELARRLNDDATGFTPESARKQIAGFRAATRRPPPGPGTLNFGEDSIAHSDQ